VFVVLVYDANVRRVTRVLKKCRQYLYWVQNSVFEGDITPGRLKRLKVCVRCLRVEPEGSE
jgi:CRISPR-associated protein Cas2